MDDKFHIYDVIVLGLGADGSAVLYHLSKQTQNILGLEQFELNHKNGSSHGDTRIIRQAYFEGQFYIPLAKRAYALWEEIELLSGEKVFLKVGGLNVSKEDYFDSSENIVKKCKEACENFDIGHKLYSNSKAINTDFEYFAFPAENQSENYQALFEYEAGYLKAEDCVRVHLNLARGNGAKVLFGCKIQRIEFSEEMGCYVFSEENTNNSNLKNKNEFNGINNVDDNDSYSKENNTNEIKERKFYAKKIVLACGSWINEILSANFSYKLPLTVDLNHVYYFKFLNNTNANSNLSNTPIFIIQEDKETEFYGFPDINNGNFFKFSLYHQNQTHNSVSEVKREHNPEIFAKMKKLCAKFIKNFSEENVELVKEINCLYTSTPDYDFIIDFLPNTDGKVIVCSACSGHGFKFASAVGEHVKQLLYGECSPFEQFKIARFGDCFLSKDN